MKKYLFLLLSGIAISGCSAPKLRTLSGGDSFNEYTAFCPSYTLGKDGKPMSTSVKGLDRIAKNRPDFTPVIEKARSYLEERGGTEFMKKVTYISVTVTFSDSTEVANKRSYSQYSTYDCRNIKYSVSFNFEPYPGTNCFIAVPLTESLMLAKDQIHIPNAFRDEDFYKVIPPEKAYRIAKRKHGSLLKKISYTKEIDMNVELMYNSELECFVWSVSGDDTQKIYKNGWYRDECWVIYVHALTGDIIGTELTQTGKWSKNNFPDIR